MTAATIVAQIVARMISCMMQEIEGLVGNLLQGDVDMYEMEQQTFASLQKMGQQVLAQVAEGRERLLGEVRCEQCGVRLRRHSRRPRVLLTLFGSTQLVRGYYYCRSCRRGQCPLDRKLKLSRAQISKALQEVLLVFGVQHSYAKAIRTLKKVLKVVVSPQTVLNHVRRVGEDVMLKEDLEQRLVEKQNRAVPSVKQAPQRLYLGMDGTMVHVHGEWREVKVGTIFAGEPCYDEQGRRQTDEAIDAMSFARLTDAEKFAALYHIRAIQRGALRVKERICVSDAASWIYDRLRGYFSQLIAIVDWYHATDHLKTMSHRLFGEGSLKAQAWTQNMETLLFQRGGKALVQSFQRDRQIRSHSDPKVTAHRDYFSRHQHKMDYPAYRKLGYHIGSGLLESACDCYVGNEPTFPGCAGRTASMPS